MRIAGGGSLAVAALDAPAANPALDQRVRLIAAGAGLVAVILVIAHFGFGARALVSAFFVSVLAVLSAIDFERRLLPNRIVLPSFALVLTAQLVIFPDQAFEWIVASLATGLVLLTAALLKPGGLGYGDVKLGLLLGAGLGESVVTALVVGVFAVWPIALYLLVRDGRAAAKLALPLGPFLAVGAVVALLTS